MRDIPILGVLWVVLTLIGEWIIQILINHWPLIASVQGNDTKFAFTFLFRAGAPAFVAVALIIIYSMIRWRVREDDEEPSKHQYRSSWRFVGSWLVITILMNLFFIVHPNITGLANIWGDAAAAARNPNTLEVDVECQQWSWHFSYPKLGIFHTTTLVLPVNTPVKFVLHSDDVIHSFWVPSFGIKKDVIPGEERVLYVTPDKITSTKDSLLTRVQCAELCGSGHSTMRAVVQVESQKNFDAWAKQNGTTSMNTSGAPAGAGS